MPPPSYRALLAELEEIAHLNSALGLLHWDRDVLMPTKGGDQRAKTIGYLTVLAHEKLTGLDKGGQLLRLHRWAEKHEGALEAAVIRETWRAYSREKKLPAAFVQELSELTSQAQAVWEQAKKKSDFKRFAPFLHKIVALKKREATYVGYTESPYDALLDAYEPDLTSRMVSSMFDELRPFLTRLVKQTKRSKHAPPSPSILRGKFPLEAQRVFNTLVAEKIGFDVNAGRIDVSAHPFTMQFHPQDVRITTRYDEANLFYSLGSTIHEVGHALYEQGLPMEHVGTPLAEALSLGIHESQSRIWENNVGKSRAFWTFFYPRLQKQFPHPFRRISLEDFYRALNRVQPSLIRTESDEVTYNLHIILRFEIEKGLIEGTMAVKDLPSIWNAKVKEYLGVSVPNDRLGVLQDVHWSAGLIGYFPTYTLGNLYAAQLSYAAHKQIPSLDALFKKGQFSPMREWLRDKVHVHGKFHMADRLVRHATGEPLKAQFFIDYLKEKYADIYRLSS